MDFFKTLEERQSIRSFTEQKIEKSKLEKILKAINIAPSAGNLQAFKIAIIEKKETKEKIASAAFGQNFISKAPLILVFLADEKESAKKYNQRGKELYCIQDATIAATYAMLSATALGLASVWIGAFNEEKIRKIIKANEGLKPIAIIPIGYAAEKPKKTPRKNISEILFKKMI